MSTKNQPTKAERRDAARQQAAAQREAQAKRDKRNRLIAIGVLILGVAAFVGAVVWILDYGKPKPLAELTAPAGANADGGITFGSDLVAGTTNEGAVELSIYLDYSCGYCQQFEETNSDVVRELTQDGSITLNMHPVAILSPKISTTGAAATAAMADVAPAQTFDFITAIFENPGLTTDAISDADLQQTAVDLGVPQETASSITDGAWNSWISAATTHAASDPALQNSEGNFGTPTILINGERFDGWQVPGALEQAVAAAAGGASDSGATDEEPAEEE